MNAVVARDDIKKPMTFDEVQTNVGEEPETAKREDHVQIAESGEQACEAQKVEAWKDWVAGCVC